MTAQSTPAEYTLVLIKPDAYERGLTGEILRRFEVKGYKLAALSIVHATEETLARHYVEHKAKHFFGPLVEYMASGPMVAVVVEGNRVLEGVRNMIGATNPTLAAPGSIRGDFGRDWGGGPIRNVVHASDSFESAHREIAIWFPDFEH